MPIPRAETLQRLATGRCNPRSGTVLQAPKSQTEIHFFPSDEGHRANARFIAERYDLA